MLREKAKPVEVFDEALRQLAADMIETMHAESGLGLAAQQVGLALSIHVVDLPADLDEDEDGERQNPDVAMPMVVINPVIEPMGKDTDSREEGCLSFPGIHGHIERPWAIHVRYQTETGEARDLTVQGLLARVIQHEVDHLNGILYIDRMSHVKRLALKGRLRRLRMETEEELGLTV